MGRRTRWALGCIAASLTLAFACFFVFDSFRWREQADPATGVALELRPPRQLIKVGQAPSLTATLVNRGQLAVTLVEPGDGSNRGWRTPVVEWSKSGWFGGGYCGNINAVKMEEVFTLQPGQSRQLCDWVGVPHVSGPGSYLVAVRYSNRPDQPWVGLPLEAHDPAAMEAISGSTPVSIVSNTVEIVIEK